jgi:hypothetical protein
MLNGRKVLFHEDPPAMIEVFEVRSMLNEIVEDCD